MAHHRKIHKVTEGSGHHWVGDGFPVNTMFSYGQDDPISPFLLMDYAHPATFPPSNTPRGVGYHPHRGFETVTIVYDGELEHHDTAGHFGRIGPGDVQWMTAARGVLHEEKHSKAFTHKGGTLEMVQLWVNLPAKEKMSAPHYQAILNKDIPVVHLAQDSGTLRVIAGKFGEATGAARTYTPIHLYDIRLKADAELSLPVEEGFHALLLVLGGTIRIGDTSLDESELAMFDTEGNTIALKAETDAKLLFLSGEPINEPIAGAGPFVMNTEEEIRQAFRDFRSGKLR